MTFTYSRREFAAYDPDKEVTIGLSFRFYDMSETPFFYKDRNSSFDFFASFKRDKILSVENDKEATNAKILIRVEISEKSLWMAFVLSGCGIEFARKHYAVVRQNIAEGMFCLAVEGANSGAISPNFKIVFVSEFAR